MNILIGRYEGEKVKMEESLCVLEPLLLKSRSTSPPDMNDLPSNEETIQIEDVVICHDSLIKGITEGILKNEGLTVKKLWAPCIKDAYSLLESMPGKPKAILLHTSTNDLQHLHEDEIVKCVLDTCRLANQRGSKVIWSCIVPRLDNDELNAKAQLVNAMIGMWLTKEDGVTLSRNGNFYNHDVINTSLYTEDGIHVNEKGGGLLAQNTKHSICRALNIESMPTSVNRRRHPRR